MLTGCLTIIDSNLKDISIESDHSHCEDALNIVRSKGSISELNLKNSQFDLVDFDFSEIKIKKAVLSNSKNDCLDFSYGKYILEEVTTSKGCAGGLPPCLSLSTLLLVGLSNSTYEHILR